MDNPYAAPQGWEDGSAELGTDRRVRRGRAWLAAVIAVTLAGDGFLVLLRVYSVGLPGAGSAVVRWILTALLFFCVWQGHQWARALMAGLMGFGLAIGLQGLMKTQHPILIVFVFVVGFVFVVLAFSPSVSVFLAYQRTQRALRKLTTGSPSQQHPQ